MYKKQNCPFCGKRFMRMKSLLDHMILRHSTRPKVCEKYLNIRNRLILDDIKTRFVN